MHLPFVEAAPELSHVGNNLLDRRLPPEFTLIKLLALLKLSPPGGRRPLVRTILDLQEPVQAGDRPAFRAWLACCLDCALGSAAIGEAAARHLPGDLRLREADQLHEAAQRLEGQPRRQRRLLEQELLLRSSLPEDWQFHRAKWRYLELQAEQTGSLLTPAEASRRARGVGIFFHPDQLQPGPHHRWFSLRRALDMLEPAAWLDLLDHLCHGRPVELSLPAGLWTPLRPWLSFLTGGAGIPLVEFYAGSLPDDPPTAARPGLLILHGEEDLDPRLQDWGMKASGLGWHLILVRAPRCPLASWLNRVSAGPAGEEWMRRQVVAGEPTEQILPLKAFVRQMERHYILDVLGLHDGVKTRACERLQISRQTLYSKLGAEGVEA